MMQGPVRFLVKIHKPQLRHLRAALGQGHDIVHEREQAQHGKKAEPATRQPALAHFENDACDNFNTK